jgi:hypothetical protein
MSQGSGDSRKLVVKLQKDNSAGWKVVESMSSRMAPKVPNIEEVRPRRGARTRGEEDSTARGEAGGAIAVTPGADIDELPIAAAKGQRAKRKKDEPVVGEGGASVDKGGRKKRQKTAQSEGGGAGPGAEAEKARKGKGAVVEEGSDESESIGVAIDAPTPKKDPNKPLLSKRESQRVLVDMRSDAKKKTLTERMAALIPADIKRCVPDGIIEVPVGLLSIDEHVINGKRISFNPRQIDEGGVENIAMRIRQNGYDTEHFMPTGIIKVRHAMLFAY